MFTLTPTKHATTFTRICTTLRRITTVALLSISIPIAAIAHESHGKPVFGGIFAEAGLVQLELVLKANELVLHVSNHGEKVDLKGASAKNTLLNGADKIELNLVPTASKFEGKPTFGALPTQKGVKAIAVVTLAGKTPTTARFEVK